VGLNFGAGGGHVQGEEHRCFLLRRPGVVHEYRTLQDVTLTAAPSSFATVEDEANVAAVEGVSVRLEPQTFPGVGGSPLCLVLTVLVSGLNVTVHTFTYQVTVLSVVEPEARDIPVGDDEVPA
jgi:hypothetical protein